MGHGMHRGKTLLASINLRGFKPPDWVDLPQRGTETDANELDGSLAVQSNVAYQFLGVLQAQNNAETALVTVNNVGHQPEEVEEIYKIEEGTTAGRNLVDITQVSQVSQESGKLRSGKVWR